MSIFMSHAFTIYFFNNNIFKIKYKNKIFGCDFYYFFSTHIKIVDFLLSLNQYCVKRINV